jgi:hypothetical protein
MVRADYSRRWWVRSVPVNGPLFDWARVNQIVMHYPGNRPSWLVPTDVAGQIRSSHEGYVKNRGYSYGYNYVVVSQRFHPLDGRSVEVRGETFRCAANAGVNEQSVAIQILQQADQPPTAAAVEGVRRLVAQFQVAARQPLRIVGHDGSGGSTRTACPGRGVQQAVDAGLFWPVPPAPTDEVDMIAVDWKPGSKDWTAFTYTGAHLAHVVNGHADQVVRDAGVKRITVSDDALLGLIQSAATTTPPPSTLSRQMRAAWISSRV